MYQQKKLLFLIFITSSFSGLFTQDFSQLPAITLQMKNHGFVKTKFATLQTEENYGLWLALDHENNQLYYKIIQNEGRENLLDMQTLQEKIKQFIRENIDSIKKNLHEIIDFNEVRKCIKIIKSHFSSTPIPQLGDFSDYFLSIATHRNIPKVTPKAKIDINKVFYNEYAHIQNQIRIWQKKYGLSPENIDDLNEIYEAIQHNINKHSLQDMFDSNSTEYSNSFSLSFGPEYDFFYLNENNVFHTSDQKPSIIHFAELTNIFLKNLVTSSQKTLQGKYKTTINGYFYLPQIDSQYGNQNNVKEFAKKCETVFDYLNKHKKNSIFKKDFSVIIKENINNVIHQTVTWIKEQQESINTAIDQTCEKLRKIF